jgi:ADP-ribose pyrophosphatase YjhB (NUDIX family)
MPMSEYVRDLRALVGPRVLEVPTVSIAVQDAQGRVLLVRHAEGNDWTTPGGMVEPYETPADAAVREMWEETGLAVELTRILGVLGGPLQSTTYRNGDRLAWVSTVFGARIVGGTPAPDGHETLELRYVGRDELAGLRCKPHLEQTLAAVWSDGHGAWFAPPAWRPPLHAAPSGRTQP